LAAKGERIRAGTIYNVPPGGDHKMRIFGVLLFAVLATALAFSMPYWQGGQMDVTATTPAAELTLAKRFVQDVRTRNFQDATAIVEPAYRPTDNTIFETLFRLFRGRSAETFRVTSWQKTFANGAASTQIQMFYDFGKDGGVQCVFTVLSERGGVAIHSAKLEPYSAAALHANDFRFPAAAPDIRWIYLGVGVAFDLFAFATFALCFISPVIRWRWRWLWLLFVLTGFVRFNLDWSSLETQFQLVAFLLPPASFYRFASYGPWILTLTAPVGGALYWAKRMQWRSAAGGEAHIP
jgi:hypothetical protein